MGVSSSRSDLEIIFKKYSQVFIKDPDTGSSYLGTK